VHKEGVGQRPCVTTGSRPLRKNRKQRGTRQIEKAKLLLAGLSGKNANVFYELGLAHAARKPVVFTSAQVEDVPFDLRHLRVIIYDIREPEWAPRLTKSVTDYLRKAMKEPGKSIPHPFRKLAEEAEGSAGVKAARRG